MERQFNDDGTAIDWSDVPAMNALVRARAACEAQDMQLQLEEPDIGTCGRCGAYHDRRYVETCHCGGYVG